MAASGPWFQVRAGGRTDQRIEDAQRQMYVRAGVDSLIAEQDRQQMLADHQQPPARFLLAGVRG